MDTLSKGSKLKKSFLKEVSVSDVMEELKVDNYFERSHHEMIACVKDTLPYKQMQEVAITHMFDTLTNTCGMPDEEARKEKKSQIAKIGLFAIQLNAEITKAISEKLSREATVIAKKALKRLSDKRLECSKSLSGRGKKRKQNEDSSDISQRNNEQNKRLQVEDSGSDVPLDGLSDKSVSSVHTSDLSSFDDEIVVSSEDEKGEKTEKRISFKTANKAYFDGGISKIHEVIFHKKNNRAGTTEKSKIEKSLSNTSKKSVETQNITSRPKRERKPNSKYSAEEMYL